MVVAVMGREQAAPGRRPVGHLDESWAQRDLRQYLRWWVSHPRNEEVLDEQRGIWSAESIPAEIDRAGRSQRPDARFVWPAIQRVDGPAQRAGESDAAYLARLEGLSQARQQQAERWQRWPRAYRLLLRDDLDAASAFVLHYLRGWSLERAAEAEHVAVGTIGARLERARRFIARQCWSWGGPGWE